jgi:predicted MarR family transcription regulator
MMTGRKVKTVRPPPEFFIVEGNVAVDITTRRKKTAFLGQALNRTAASNEKFVQNRVRNTKIAEAAAEGKIGRERTVKITAAGGRESKILADTQKREGLVRLMCRVPYFESAESVFFQPFNQTAQTA